MIALTWQAATTPGVFVAQVGRFHLSTSGLSWRVSVHGKGIVTLASGRADYDPRHDAVEALAKICTETLQALGRHPAPQTGPQPSRGYPWDDRNE